MSKIDLRGKTVLITGAAMGMGRLYADLAAQDGAAHVILWDINEDLLAKADAELPDCDVHCYTVDVSSLEAIRDAAGKVLADVGVPDVLINNAGIVRGKYFWEHDHEVDIELVMRINALAPMHITRAFLPAMMEGGTERRIVNIASAGGLVSNPKMSVYSASKWAAVGWSDSLRLELLKTGHGNIKVTTVCPTYIATGMFEGVKTILMTPILTPEAVVTKVWRYMKPGKPFVIMPWTTQLGKILKGTLPTRAWDLMADRVFGIYGTMDSFVGREGRQQPTTGKR